jgi:hypothetical protein
VAAVEFAILGPVEVTAGGQRLRVGGPRVRAVLARLIVAANHVVAAEALAGELWPDLDLDRAVANLQVRVAELRRVFGQAGTADRLVTRAPGYVLADVPEPAEGRSGRLQSARCRDRGCGRVAARAPSLGIYSSPMSARLSRSSLIRGSSLGRVLSRRLTVSRSSARASPYRPSLRYTRASSARLRSVSG